ncbi:GrpB family protein [Lysobacter sp. CA199]|uniref:GrpB family protein n=1 Tax=Lysobacter sp. CA199 TaxID=3455608 RepID=UPI003F8D0BCE
MNQQRIITIVDYDPSWPRTFDELKSAVLRVLGDITLSVEHVGSTSVPGLAAKPIIDMDVVVASAAEVPRAIERLATLGYAHRGDLGIEGRDAFYSPPELPVHHLYVCVHDAIALANHLTIRDYLRRNQAAARTYGLLKMRLAKMFPTDVDRYTDGKSGFLLSILRENDFPDEVLTAIGEANRADR